MKMIQLEEDYPANHDDWKIPIPDITCWVEKENGRSVIRHTFYRKPMSLMKVIHKRSALPDTQKSSILAEELCRRLRNCYPKMPWVGKMKIVTSFSMDFRR